MYKYLGLIYIGNEGSYSDMKFTIKTGEAVITEANHASNVIGDFPDKFQLISAEDCELILSNGTVTANSPYPFYNQLDDFDPESLGSLPPPFEDEDEDFGQDAIDADTAQCLKEFDDAIMAEYEAQLEAESNEDEEDFVVHSLDEVDFQVSDEATDSDVTEPDCETQ